MLYRYTHTVQSPWQFNGAVRSNKWDKTGFCFCALLFYRRTQHKKKNNTHVTLSAITIYIFFNCQKVFLFISF